MKKFNVNLLAMRRLLATKTALVSILTRNQMEYEKIRDRNDASIFRFFVTVTRPFKISSSSFLMKPYAR